MLRAMSFQSQFQAHQTPLNQGERPTQTKPLAPTCKQSPINRWAISKMRPHLFLSMACAFGAILVGTSPISTLPANASPSEESISEPFDAASSASASASIIAATRDGTEIERPITDPGPLEMRALDYIRFRQDVAHIESMTFDNAQVTRDAHLRLSTHDSRALTAGFMAYAALIAADTPEFAESLKAELRGENDVEDEKKKKKKRRKKKKDGMDETELAAARAAFLAKLSADPRYPRSLPGAQQAIDNVLAVIRRDNLRVSSLGENFKSKAYSMQKTRWGKARLATPSVRIREAEDYGYTRPGIALPTFSSITEQGIAQPGITSMSSSTWTHEWGYPSSITGRRARGSDAIFDRILNLASRYSVGAVNDRVVGSYAKNNKSEQCLSMSRLTLNQCIAATRTPYEEAFCLGEHALNDVASCVGWVAQ